MSRAAYRFAPSPNGRLHLGHAYSALLNAREADRTGARFLLRIEDIDRIRCTRALGEAALADLAWLGLDWERPVRWQSGHIGEYRAALARLDDKGLLYPCFCSRREIAAVAQLGKADPEGQPLYPGTCRSLGVATRDRLIARGEPFALRLDMAAALGTIGSDLSFIELGTGEPVEIPARPELWGDVVLARKDIGTSYHVAVVTDDAMQGITHVVRGRDLYEATAIHRLLQELLGLPVPVYQHHVLIGDETGRKLSKSAGDRSLASLREAGVRCGEVRAALGF